MQVLRVEKPDGQGPYNALTYTVVHGLDPSSWDVDNWRHPSPYDDIGGYPASNSWEGKSFGFETRTDFEKWFSLSDRRRLMRQGFQLATYDVHGRYVVKGMKQCAFARDHAVPIKTEPLLTDNDELQELTQRYGGSNENRTYRIG